jgi:hypothetical protein
MPAKASTTRPVERLPDALAVIQRRLPAGRRINKPQRLLRLALAEPVRLFIFSSAMRSPA